MALLVLLFSATGLGASVAVGCSTKRPGLDAASESGGGMSAGGKGASRDGGAGESGGDPLGSINTGDRDAGSTTHDAACAISSAEAKSVTLNMFIMFDKSGSMKEGGKWTYATSALKAFFRDPATAGLRVALRFFPDMGCDKPSCDIDVCSQPLVPLASLTALEAPADAQEEALVNAVDEKIPNGGTPMSAALGGAERWAQTYKATHENEKTVVVLLTDGEPNGCEESVDEIKKLAEAAFSASGVLTYTVGLQGSEADTLNQIAEAGGTQNAFFIGAGNNVQADLLAALKAIQASQVACRFAMPKAGDKGPINPALVDVGYTVGGKGSATTITKVKNADACAGEGLGWYYDAPQAPKEIVLCPSTCATVQADPAAKIEISFGCTAEGPR